MCIKQCKRLLVPQAAIGSLCEPPLSPQKKPLLGMDDGHSDTSHGGGFESGTLLLGLLDAIGQIWAIGQRFSIDVYRVCSQQYKGSL